MAIARAHLVDLAVTCWYRRRSAEGGLHHPLSTAGVPLGFSLANYLLAFDYTGRLFREGKATISRELAAIFECLGTTAQAWQARLGN